MKTSYISKISNFLFGKKNKKYAFAILIIGVVMLCLPSFTGEEEGEKINTQSFSIMENSREMEKILSEISGVGKCEVMVTYKCSKEYIIAKDKSENGDSNEEKNVVTGSGRDEKPFIIKEEMPKVLGVVVVCEGGADIKVQKNVCEAVCALCGIRADKVKVFKK